MTREARCRAATRLVRSRPDGQGVRGGRASPGEVSEVVETDFGYHLISGEDRRQEVPEDEDELAQRQRLIEQRKQTAWQEYQERLESRRIEIVDPELQAHKLLRRTRW